MPGLPSGKLPQSDARPRAFGIAPAPSWWKSQRTSRRTAARETYGNHCDSFCDRREANQGDWVLIGSPVRTGLLAFWHRLSIPDWLVVPGAAVTFAVPAAWSCVSSSPRVHCRPRASGTFGTSSTATTVQTDGSGVATAPALTANGTTGSYIVTASVPGVSAPASFKVRNWRRSGRDNRPGG